MIFFFYFYNQIKCSRLYYNALYSFFERSLLSQFATTFLIQVNRQKVCKTRREFQSHAVPEPRLPRWRSCSLSPSSSAGFAPRHSWWFHWPRSLRHRLGRKIKTIKQTNKTNLTHSSEIIFLKFEAFLTTHPLRLGSWLLWMAFANSARRIFPSSSHRIYLEYLKVLFAACQDECITDNAADELTKITENGTITWRWFNMSRFTRSHNKVEK